MQINAIKLKEDLEFLMGHLGEYDWGDITSKAISVLPDYDLGFNYPPSRVTVSGIELVIISPKIKFKQLTGEDIKFTHTWTIILKSWETTNYGLMRELTQTALQTLNSAGYKILSCTTHDPSQGLMLGQAIIEIAESWIEV